MRLIDLTLPIPEVENGKPTSQIEEWPIDAAGISYTGMVYNFSHWSMSGTYIDLPGHIKETDDSVRAGDYPLDKLYEVPSMVIHLDRSETPGKISAGELEQACSVPIIGGGLVINALGSKRFDEIPERSLALSKDAVAWILDHGVHLLASDVYEHADEPENVFMDLFSGGACTVCYPVNLHLLDSAAVNLTVLFPRFPGVTQLPCRIIASLPEKP